MISALVTLFNPLEEHFENIKALQAQVDRVIICDNSSSDHSKDVPKGCKYTTVHQNLGISVAFNRVLKDPKYSWGLDDIIVFFDQDSRIEKGHIKRLVEAYDICENKGYKVGCVGPLFLDSSSDRIMGIKKNYKVSKGIYEVQTIITSSMMCKYSALKSVGFWNESVFLDMADWDLCWRLESKGYRSYITTKCVIHHKLGSGVVRVGPIALRSGAPVRDYYETRDCLKLFFLNYTPVFYRIRFILQLTIRPVVRIVLLEKRKERFCYIMRGLYDYRKGINGAYQR